MKRLSLARTAYFLQVAQLTADRSTCLRASVGAVIIREGRIISTGYNGAPPGMPHCDQYNCLENPPCLNAIHAEKNAIAFAARAGVSTQDAEMWCTHAPCLACAQLILAAGIDELHYTTEYRIKDGVQLLYDAGLTVQQHE